MALSDRLGETARLLFPIALAREIRDGINLAAEALDDLREVIPILRKLLRKAEALETAATTLCEKEHQLAQLVDSFQGQVTDLHQELTKVTQELPLVHKLLSELRELEATAEEFERETKPVSRIADRIENVVSKVTRDKE